MVYKTLIIKIINRVFLILFGIAISLLLGEFIMRIIIPPLPETYGHIHQPSTNSKLVYELVPNNKGVDMGAEVEINSHGLRDKEYRLEKQENVYRILVLGDSWTFGTGMNLDETYVKQLEKLLNTNDPSREYEVINCGVGGYNTVREVELFKEKNLILFNPDLVIIGYNIHNIEIGHQFRNPKQKSDNNGSHRIQYEGPNTTFLTYDTIRKLKNFSVLFQTIIYRNETLFKTLKIRDYEPLYSDSSEGGTAARASLAELLDIANSRDISVLLVCFPVLSNLDDSFPFSSIHQIVGKAADSLGIMFYDLFPDFKGLKGSSLWLHQLDRHPNAKGHTIIADGIYRYLKKIL